MILNVLNTKESRGCHYFPNFLQPSKGQGAEFERLVVECQLVHSVQFADNQVLRVVKLIRGGIRYRQLESEDEKLVEKVLEKKKRDRHGDIAPIATKENSRDESKITVTEMD